MSIRDNTNRRLKEVLDIMAAGSWLDEKPNGGVVLAEAVARVPFTKEEAEILSGGIPRGHKNLTKATADLVKAGWMTKGRSGWEITEEGLKATVVFTTVETLAEALSSGAQAPAGTALPEQPTAKQAVKAPAKKAAAKKPAAKKASAKATPANEADNQASQKSGVEHKEQPTSVALAGDFGTTLGAVENWDPSHNNVQMSLDAKQGTWKLTADLPAGQYSYKAVVNGSWDENYGAFGVNDGANHEFAHAGGPVTFHYDHTTKDVLRSEV
ncbi:glycosidase [Arthrobacter glacialis]|uniref:pullulanase X25 domain-containing protein n=1 Tax=Arthrobacter glacialis TaxID=1664 RepID=UPI001FAF96AE|nr:glycosidase [Arthrobacter glacialis]